MEVETAKARPSDVAESPNSNQEIHEDTNFQNDENGDEFANADDLDADDDQEDARALQLIQTLWAELAGRLAHHRQLIEAEDEAAAGLVRDLDETAVADDDDDDAAAQQQRLIREKFSRLQRDVEAVRAKLHAPDGPLSADGDDDAHAQWLKDEYSQIKETLDRLRQQEQQQESSTTKQRLQTRWLPSSITISWTRLLDPWQIALWVAVFAVQYQLVRLLRAIYSYSGAESADGGGGSFP